MPKIRFILLYRFTADEVEHNGIHRDVTWPIPNKGDVFPIGNMQWTPRTILHLLEANRIDVTLEKVSDGKSWNSKDVVLMFNQLLKSGEWKPHK